MSAPTLAGTAVRERLAHLSTAERSTLLRRLRPNSEPAPAGYPWFVVHPARAGKPTARLFCFSYAGSGASTFRTWKAFVPAGVEVWACQLPGREHRIQEPAHRLMGTLVEELAAAIAPHLDLPYAFYGHSMGALLGYELAHTLRGTSYPAPLRLFLAAFRAPHLPNPNIKIHHLPDEVLKTVLQTEGTPQRVLDNEELMKGLLPTLRADLELCDTYQYHSRPPLNVPLSIFGGTEDVRVEQQDLELWNSETSSSFDLVMLPGAHFFLHSAQSLLLSRLSRELEIDLITEGERSHD